MNHCIQLYSGELVDVMSIPIEKIHLIDIAHALANTCRFHGHCSKYYSVAEHSVLMADRTGTKEGLLHDAAEAYIGDLAGPIKRHESLSVFRGIEDEIMEKIIQKFCLDRERMVEVEKEDKYILGIEMYYLFPPIYHYTSLRVGPSNFIQIEGWSPEKAKKKFLDYCGYFRLWGY